MYDDILGEKEEKEENENESCTQKNDLIEALKANIEQKDKFIKLLLDQVTDLEKENEYLKQL